MENSDFEYLIGATWTPELEEIVNGKVNVLRVFTSKFQAGTCDMLSLRLNVVLDNNIVTEAYFG